MIEFPMSLLVLLSLHSPNAIVHKKEAMVVIVNPENGVRHTVTVPRNQIVLAVRELTENVLKKKIDDVRCLDQGLVPDRPESNSKLHFDI